MSSPSTSPDSERDLVLIGLAVLTDPLRPEAAATVSGVTEAGVHLVMVLETMPALRPPWRMRLAWPMRTPSHDGKSVDEGVPSSPCLRSRCSHVSIPSRNCSWWMPFRPKV